jgi:hypothetical protein
LRSSDGREFASQCLSSDGSGTAPIIRYGTVAMSSGGSSNFNTNWISAARTGE